MANTPTNVVATLTSMPQYVDWFKASFPDDAQPVTFDNFAKAIEACEATLITPATFDAWLHDDDSALSEMETAGLTAFMENGCASCHGGVNLGGQEYYPFGLVEKSGADVLPVGDKGRFSVTETTDDEYVFRAAPLRNIALTAPYFHSGKVWDLETAVEIMATSQLGTELDTGDVEAITAFLKSLTGDLPEVVFPVLPAETRATPRPTGDVIGGS